MNVDVSKVAAKLAATLSDSDKEEAPSAEASPVAEPTEAPEQPDSSSEKQETDQPADESKPVEASPEPTEAPAAKKRQIVVNGQVEEIDETELVRRAQMGTDYTRKTQALAEKSRRLEKLVEDLEPWIAKAQKLQSQEEAEAEDDPVLKAQKTAERAVAETEALRAEQRSREDAEGVARFQQQAVATVNAERAKHKVFERVKGNAEVEQWIAEKLSDDILIGRIDPTEAVARAARALESVFKAAAPSQSYLKGKVEDAKKSPVPKPGAPAPSQVKKFTASDLKDGRVLESVRNRLRAMGST